MYYASNPPHDLTYDDVFLVPGKSDIESRMEVDLTSPDGTTFIPIVVANMTSVAGKRMAETVARRGGLVVLPQDLPVDDVFKVKQWMCTRDPLWDTPLTVREDAAVADVLNLINKRSHGYVVVVSDNNQPVGLVSAEQCRGIDQFTRVYAAMSVKPLKYVNDGSVTPEYIYRALVNNRQDAALGIDTDGKLIGILTKKAALRADIYIPNGSYQGGLAVAAAIGVNGDIEDKITSLLESRINTFVVDTAHGHQQRTLEVVKQVRQASLTATIVAGNVVTPRGTEDLIMAGANIVKVGVGPGAMCTTRMMTGVGRPQFSAVAECASVAKQLDGYVWADGGIRHPRDVALALAAGASNVMIGSWFAGTYESPGDILVDSEGRQYKESYGMASRRAVKARTLHDDTWARARKEFFEEGISTSKMYIDPQNPGVEDLIDKICFGVRSACSYVGAYNLEEFHEAAQIGIQSPAGMAEAKPLFRSW